ncbi:hypothetical protein Acid345_3235 [Candidatus Koribacter versatilis Ellin345]|uniref:Lipoprotein SmpA/OmlA domain-containing protein n=1 Tax=Koribacter versatilis (strain Ellin345) TaxID=204669 RepID=Q1ILL4_KORVE|nr:hypothetical protein [Candidatus Koribacter versatilis]ABF42236.1 hypothetical protein Acid345_3235 [Candidatus Koribacter versatilis Ellin345]
MFNAETEQQSKNSKTVPIFVGVTALVVALLVIISAQRTSPAIFHEADSFHDSYNPEDWRSLVHAGISQKCAFTGMSKSDVIAALGAPGTVDTVSDGSETWTYMIPDMNTCASYGTSAADCLQRPLKQELIRITPAGHMLKGTIGVGCQAQMFASLH